MLPALHVVHTDCFSDASRLLSYIDDLIHEINHKHLSVNCQLCSLSTIDIDGTLSICMV